MGLSHAHTDASGEIRLHIARIVLEGVNIPVGQSHLLQASVQAALARLLANGRVPPKLVTRGAVPQIFTKAIQLASANDVVTLGERIAQAVHGGIVK